MDKYIEYLIDEAHLTRTHLNKLHKLGFFSAPASKGHHLASMGGLCAHSCNVSRRLVSLTSALGVKWSRPESPWIVGMLHDLVKCKCYKLREDASGYDYHQPVYPGHGVASVIIATVEVGVKLNPDEAAAITWHMGAFGLQGRALAEFDAALDVYPAQIIATHTADWAAARIDESGDWSAERTVVE